MMSPAGFEHGRVVSRINARLALFVEAHALGAVTGAETGFLLRRRPDTVRAPDVGFVAAARLPPRGWSRFFPGAPDAAVEVLSPGDRLREVRAKVVDWLAAGCGLVWVVDPHKPTVTVHRPGRSPRTLVGGDFLTGEDVIAGFRLPVAEIFGD